MKARAGIRDRTRMPKDSSRWPNREVTRHTSPRPAGYRYNIGGTNGRTRRSRVRTNTRGCGALSLILFVSKLTRFKVSKVFLILNN